MVVVTIQSTRERVSSTLTCQGLLLIRAITRSGLLVEHMHSDRALSSSIIQLTSDASGRWGAGLLLPNMMHYLLRLSMSVSEAAGHFAAEDKIMAYPDSLGTAISICL